MRKWYSMKAGADGKPAEINIFDEIGKSFFEDDAVSAKQFKADLAALGDVKEINLHVNSPGGDVMDGVAIHNMLKDHPAKITAYVDGWAASAASYVIMAADKIIMPENTFMVVHKPHGAGYGTDDDLLARAADMARMTDTFIGTYAKRSKQEPAAVKALMLEDRLLTAPEAKAMGYADELGQPVKMAANFNGSADARMPKAMRDKFKAVMSAGKTAAELAAAQAAGDEAAARARAEADRLAAAGGAATNVVDIATARKAGRADALAYAVEVRDLCKLAGFPDLAADFIAADKPIAEVRAALAKAKVDAEAGETHGQHQSRSARADNQVQVKAGWAKAVSKVNARAGFPTAAQ